MECEPLMDARKVATLLGVSLRTLDTLVARGEAPVFIRVGQARRWRMAEINAWIEVRLGGGGNIRYAEVFRELEQKYGPMVSGQALSRLLGYRTGADFRQAAMRGVLPVQVFTNPERKGKFAWVRDVAAWLVTLETNGRTTKK